MTFTGECGGEICPGVSRTRPNRGS
jgi:hypothetical protein